MLALSNGYARGSDRRERQEIMTLDKVTLRMNALSPTRSTMPSRGVGSHGRASIALSRRAAGFAGSDRVGELDSFLTGKDEVAQELEQQVRAQAARWV